MRTIEFIWQFFKYIYYLTLFILGSCYIINTTEDISDISFTTWAYSMITLYFLYKTLMLHDKIEDGVKKSVKNITDINIKTHE